MAQSSDNGGRAGAQKQSGPPVWRSVFDALERPVTRSSEAWVQTNAFMDGLALAWRVERRVDRELRRGVEMWLGAWRLATRGDLDRLSNEIARVERELRALRRDLGRAGTDAEPRAAAGRRGTPASARRTPTQSRG